jgi:hypothetical protein
VTATNGAAEIFQRGAVAEADSSGSGAGAILVGEKGPVIEKHGRVHSYS